MLPHVWTIARNTFTESVRQPVFVVLLLGTILLLALGPAICANTLDDDNKLLMDVGLSTLVLAGLLLAAFSATGVLSREIENQTVLSVLSKPVGRPAFVLGKYLGVTGAVGVAFVVWSFAFLLTVRHKVPMHAAEELDLPVLVFGLGAVLLAAGIAVCGNYFFGWVFASALTALLTPLLASAFVLTLALDKHWQIQELTHDLNGQLLWALLLVLETLGMLCAVAIAASIRLRQVPTLLCCIAFFLLGLSSSYFFGPSTQAQGVAVLWHALVPNLGFLWQADALTQGNILTPEHVALVSAYAGLHTLAALGLAVALFQTREVG